MQVTSEKVMTNALSLEIISAEITQGNTITLNIQNPQISLANNILSISYVLVSRLNRSKSTRVS